MVHVAKDMVLAVMGMGVVVLNEKNGEQTSLLMI